MCSSPLDVVVLPESPTVLYFERDFHRLAIPHLVGDGAVADEPCGDVGCFCLGTTKKKRFKKLYWLEEFVLDGLSAAFFLFSMA